MCMQSKERGQIVSNEIIKILNFNVEGLTTELDDPSFIDLLYKHDICLLSETWRSDDTKLGLPGLWDFSVVRPKSRKALRHSGGVSVICKDKLRRGIKISHSSEGFIWLKLDSNFFKFDADIYLCVAYIPPEYTSRRVNNATNYFQDLMDAIMKYSAKGHILIAGDLNARTGGLETSNHFEIPVLEDLGFFENSDNIPPRSSCDNISNRYGKKLEDLCKSFNLFIANGRVAGDRVGNFTCFTKRGSSIVDYFIGDQYLLGRMLKLSVLDPEFGSVHAPLSLELKCEFDASSVGDNTPPIQSPPKLIWDNSKREVFLKLLEQSDFQTELADINDIVTNPLCTKLEAEFAAKKLTDSLFETAKRCFKMVKRRKKTGSHKKANKNPWYNQECKQLKSRLKNVANLLIKSPKDPYIRGKLVVLRKQYRKAMRASKKVFEITNLETLQKLKHHPKDFWTHFKKLNKANKSDHGGNIPPEQWVSHFHKISSKDPALFPANFDQCNKVKSQVESLSKQAESKPACPTLDAVFTKGEVIWGIKSLKNGKATAFDGITNDLLKSAKDVIAQSLTNIFNKLAFFQHFPKQ